MHPLTIATTAALLLGLTGCPGPGPGVIDAEHPDDPVDGVWCGHSRTAARVYIDIAYADDGMPSVAPETCTVDPATHVTWRAPVGGAGFTIVFAGTSPAADMRTARATSQGGIESREKAGLTVGDQSGSYKYAVVANGKTLDPAIIIR